MRNCNLPNEWLQKKLSDVGISYSGLKSKSKKDFVYEGNAKFVTYRNINKNYFVDKYNLATVQIEKNENQNNVLKGDILFTGSSETPDEVAFSSVVKDDIDDLYLNSFSFGYRFSNLEKFSPEFYAYFFRGPYFRNVVFPLAQGSTRYNISKNELLKVNIPVPSMPEQQKIASILSSVDEAIGQTEAIKNQTEIVRRGLKDQILSKGINKNEFKETPIGEVPSDWDVLQLDKIASLRKEKFNPKNKPEETKYIGLEHINQATGSLNSFGSSLDTASMKNRFYKEDVLFSKLRPYLKKYWFAHFEGVCGSEILPIIANEQVLPKYLYYLLSQDKLIDEISSKTFGTRMPRTSWNDLKVFQFAIPPLKEQEEIIRIIEVHDDKILNETNKKNKLSDIKKGLMQQLLTGKVRVPIHGNEEVPK